MTFSFFVGRELPTWDLWCPDADGDPVDLTGYTVEVLLRQAGTDRSLAGTSTINVGPSGTGTGSSPGTPSLNFAPDAGELDDFAPGKATVIVVATTGGKDREWQFPVTVNT